MIKRIQYNKLVRDLIPRIISEDKEVEGFSVKRLSKNDLKASLINKLYEEVDELLEASGDDQSSVEELVDILEVVFALAEFYGIRKTSLLDLAECKRETTGGFKEGLFLEFVSKEASQ